MCAHLRQFYPESVTGEPPSFIGIDRDRFVTPATVDQQTTDTGDECHYNVNGLSDNQLKRIFKEIHKSTADVEICDNCVPRQATDADFVDK